MQSGGPCDIPSPQFPFLSHPSPLTSPHFSFHLISLSLSRLFLEGVATLEAGRTDSCQHPV